MSIESIMNFKMKKLDIKGMKDKFKEKDIIKDVQVPKIDFNKKKGNLKIMNLMKTKKHNIFKSLSNKTVLPSANRASSKLDRILKKRKNTGVKFGMARIKQQKGLKAFNDFDKDGLPNALDCNPRNRRLQGPEHSIEDKMNPSDDLRRNDQEIPIYQPEQDEVQVSVGDPMMRRENVPITESSQQPVDVTVQPPETRRQRAVDSAKAFLLKLGTEEKQAKQQAAEQRSDIQTKAFLQAQREIERAKITREKRRLKAEALGSPSRVRGEKAKAVEAVRQVGTTFSTVGAGIRKTNGFGINREALASSQTPRAQHLLEVLGKAPPPQPQQQVTQAQSVCEAQADPSQGIISPSSKRRVSYIRGPYNKRR